MAKTRGDDPGSSARHDLRLRIEEILPTMDDLEEFVGDYFNDVFRQYSAAMTRIQRLNLLLERATPDKIAKSLSLFQREKKVSGLNSPPLKKKSKDSPLVCVLLPPPAGETFIELLYALEKWCRDHCAESLLKEHRELHAEPTSNGWRRLALQLTGRSVVLEAFPALLDPRGSPEPKLRVQVAQGTAKEFSFIYLPLGRGGREYRVSLCTGKKISVSLEPKDLPGRITFEIAEPLGADLGMSASL